MIYKCNEPECDKEYDSYNSLFKHRQIKHKYQAVNTTKPKPTDYLEEFKTELEKIKSSIPQNNNKEIIVEKSETTRTENKEPDVKTGFYFLVFLTGMSLIQALWQKGFFNSFISTE